MNPEPVQSPSPPSEAATAPPGVQAHAAAPRPVAAPGPALYGVARRFPWVPWVVGGIFALGVTFFHLSIDFRGLSSPAGMEQGQMARELSRGKGLKTKVWRPATVARQAARFSIGEGTASFHGPLWPVVTAMGLKLSGTEYAVDGRYRVFFPDRVIASMAAVFFLAAAGVTFFLAKRLFDTRIAVATVLCLLVCDWCWEFVKSGLPQMLGMFSFVLALSFMERAQWRWRSGLVPLTPLLGASACLGLLTLALPAALGIALGALLFVSLNYRKRVLIPIVFGAVLTLVLAPWLAWNLRSSGSLLGEGILQVYESWSPNPGSPVMRNYDPDGETLPKIDLARKIWRVFDQHREEAWVFLGGLAAAPLFFLSLLHPFRNPEAARLRWAVLSLWGGAQLAMGIFGTPEGALDPNLLHVLFLPVAAMYGLAFLSVLWSRLPLARNPFSLWRHAHLIAAIAISAMPLLAEFSGRALLGARYRNRIVQWPPYDPVALAYVGKWTREDQLIFSDVPWAVAWYADRPSVWLPMRPPQMDAISAAWTAGGTREVGGLYLTPASLDGRLSTNLTQGEFRDWARLLLRGQVSRFGSDLLSKPPASLRYWQRMSPVLDRESWFIAAAPLWQNPPVETAAE